jgi:excinuclease ABC subunit A
VIHHACELGLGYLTLGQSSATLSGGESQRIKLVSELSRRGNGHTIYLLDEPTVGLHRRDVSRLLNMLRSLTAKGNTVVLIEHDRDVLENSDHIVEFGPGPGEMGGRVVFQGSIASLKRSRSPWGKLLEA